MVYASFDEAQNPQSRANVALSERGLTKADLAVLLHDEKGLTMLESAVKNGSVEALYISRDCGLENLANQMEGKGITTATI